MQISSPSDGRVYSVCQFLSQLPDVRFSEPNHLILRHESDLQPSASKIDMEKKSPIPKPMPAIDKNIFPSLSSFENASENGWTTVIYESFEGDIIPDGWITGSEPGYTDTEWQITAYRSHEENQSFYATGNAPLKTINKKNNTNPIRYDNLCFKSE